MAPTTSPTIFWILLGICVLSGSGLYLLVRPNRLRSAAGRSLKALGAVLGLGAFALMIVNAALSLKITGDDARPEVFYVIFSLIALAAAVRMITHTRPVYAALYFVLVVLASAGLFLLMAAEFMAFALIIVYAGAILITYLFVLMLAQQSPDPDDPTGQPEYDLIPREPVAGAVVGFIVLALLGQMIYGGLGGLPEQITDVQAREAAWRQLTDMPAQIERYSGLENLEEVERTSFRIEPTADAVTATLHYRLVGGGEDLSVDLPREAMPDNIRRVGLGLILKFPVSLELAGVILLMAMFGAVILARKQIELTEDEKREAAGMRRLGYHDEPERSEPQGGGA